MTDTLIETKERRYFTIVPNLVDDLGLDPYAFRLYTHLRRVAGEDGQCWKSTRTLANHCKMSIGRISEAKQALVEAGLIVIEIKSGAGGQYHCITIQDIWLENVSAYNGEKRSSGEHIGERSSGEHKTEERSLDEHTKAKKRSPSERKKNPSSLKKNPSSKKNTRGSAAADRAPEPENEPEQPEPRTPAQAMFEALATACAWEIGLLTDKQRGQLNQTEKKLRNLPGQTVTPADVLDFGNWWLTHDWRGKQGEHPRPDQVRSEWGRFRYWQRQQAEAEATRKEAAKHAERVRAAERQAAETGSPELVAARQLWGGALAELALQIDGAAYTQWLEKTRAVGQVNGCLRVGVESERVKDWLENRLGEKIRGALKYVSEGAVTGVEFVVGSNQEQ